MLAMTTETHRRARKTLAVFGIKTLEPVAGSSENDEMHKPATVYGPYRDGKKWRVVVVEAGIRKGLTVDSRAEAEEVKEAMKRALVEKGSRSIGDVLEEWLDYKRASGLSDRSFATLSHKVKGFLPLDMAISSLTPDKAESLYKAETTRITKFKRETSASTHRILLRTTKRFFRWVVSKGYITSNPFEAVEPIGKVNNGKRQLTKDEAMRLTDVLFVDAHSGDEAATALLAQLFLGLRTSEILLRVARDLDDSGRILVIPFGKTRNARRRLEVPESLRPLLQRQAQGKSPDSLLFGADRAQPFATDKLWDRLQRYCRKLGLPRVCPHSLRGLHSTLALDAGITANAVAASLGHGNFGVTERHYADPSTVKNARVRRVAETLDAHKPAPTPTMDTEALTAALRALPFEKLQELLRGVGGSR